MKLSYILLVVLCLHLNCHGQAQNDSVRKILRWQAKIGSGLFVDLFYKNIYIGNYGNSTAPGYPDKKGDRVKPGKIDRLEWQYNFKGNRSAISINFQNALFKDIYGSDKDPLGAWKSITRYKRRIQFSVNYFRQYTLTSRNQLEVSLGFMISGEQNSFPFYTINNGITEIGATGSNYFWDPGLALNVHYFHSIGKHLSLGATFYTYYLHQIGFEGAALQGIIGIRF
jgi:hypothetical protein